MHNKDHNAKKIPVPKRTFAGSCEYADIFAQISFLLCFLVLLYFTILKTSVHKFYSNNHTSYFLTEDTILISCC